VRQAPPPFLLDTHIWFWYLTGSDRLPGTLRATIDANLGRLWLSPVSVWELGMLAGRRRVALKRPLRQWVDEAHRYLSPQEAPLNREVAVVSAEIDLAHRDPADHFLAATALVYQLTLMTVDERLTVAAWLPTRSA
jgi:PIN domain nuclease of toxin-antitoxin system